MTGARRLAGRAALAAGALLLSLAAVEVGLRAAGRLPPVDAPPIRLPGIAGDAEPFTRRDDLLLYALIPGARTYSWCSIDAHGYRTPPFSDVKPPGAFRIITTGDSTTFGLSVLEPQHWSSVLRRALTGLCAGAREIEVVNAGVTGYSTLQNRLQIERDLLPLQPDLVVWLVTGVNDTTRVEGQGDAEQSSRQRSLLFGLARLRVARLLGLGRFGWLGVSPNAEPGSPTSTPRVTLDEVEANLDAVLALLPDRLLLGLFPPQPAVREAQAIAALDERAAAWATARGLPLADLRPVLAGLLPFPLYIDNVHPNSLGHTLIARAVLAAVLPRLGLPAERAAWIAAWQQSLAGGIAGQADVLSGPGAPPRFAELAALYADRAALDARLSRLDAALPEAVREWDPLLGRRCRETSSARLALDATADAAERRAEIERWVLPRDPLLACFADEAAFLAASDSLRGLARAAIVFGAELGLPPVRADLRRGQACQAGDPATAVELLAAVVALSPSDAESRYDLAIALRRAGRLDEARAQWRQLAADSGPLSDFAAGMLAYEERLFDEAERVLTRAVEQRPSLGLARTLLGRIYLEQDRLDEALREFAFAAGLLGATEDFPALREQIEARRRELRQSGGEPR